MLVSPPYGVPLIYTKSFNNLQNFSKEKYATICTQDMFCSIVNFQSMARKYQFMESISVQGSSHFWSGKGKQLQKIIRRFMSSLI